MRHSTEARTTMSLSQTEKECFKSVLENVNGWNSPTAQWKRVPESWCRDRETTSSNVDVVQGNGKKTFELMIVTNATDYMGGSDEQGRPVDDERSPSSRDWRVYS